VATRAEHLELSWLQLFRPTGDETSRTRPPVEAFHPYAGISAIDDLRQNRNKLNISPDRI
jgi:hypothetical protein